MRQIDGPELAAGVPPLEVEDDGLIESVVMLVKVSNGDGTSSLHRVETEGMSYWEAVGMVYDSLQGMSSEAAWRE